MLRQLLPHRFLRTAVLGHRAFFPPTLPPFNLGRHCPEDVGLRPFSSRPHRPRGGSESHGYDGRRGSSDSFGSVTLRRGEFQTGSLSGRGEGGPKSLIEDEAELSDWVGGINTSSLSLGLSSESDEDSGRGSGMGRGRGRRGGRDGVPSSTRSRDGDFDDYGRRRSSRGLPSKRSGKLYSDNDDDDVDDEDEDELFSSRKRPTGLRSRDELSSRGGRHGGSKLSRGRDDGDSMRRRIAPAKRARRIMESEDDEDDIGDLSGLGESDEEESDSDIELFKGGAHKVESETIRRKEMAPKSTSNGKSGSYLSETRFDQCSISPLSLKGIKEAGYEKMTVVQEATLPLILKGKDVLAKAKTGTGKTVAFLLPAIEVVAKVPPPDRDNKRPPITVLIVCPTRELATQASNEANKLLKFHPSIGVQVVIGGTRLALEQKRMQANPCQILVATPGRLRDHIENTPGFASRLMGVKVLVLDEADHLLDMGFRKDIEKIVAAVPKQRQSLLFSATVPEEVQQIGLIALKRDYEFINTVQEGSEETHAQVKQMHLVAPLDKHFALLYSILKEHIGEEADYKVLVFCTTAMVTRLVSELLAELNLNVREIHSRKPQSYRTRVSDEFRRSKGLILVTSDVSARGVDYPDVTLVVQVGLPSEREQYIHRLGRTGRKGKEGKGILLLAPWEEFFLSSINDLPITKAPTPSIDPDMRKKVDRALSHVQMKNKEAAYQAWLGYYNSSKNIGRDKVRLVQLANEFSRSMGMDNPPSIPKLVIGKMGLKNVPGLRIK